MKRLTQKQIKSCGLKHAAFLSPLNSRDIYSMMVCLSKYSLPLAMRCEQAGLKNGDKLHAAVKKTMEEAKKCYDAARRGLEK